MELYHPQAAEVVLDVLRPPLLPQIESIEDLLVGDGDSSASKLTVSSVSAQESMLRTFGRHRIAARPETVEAILAEVHEGLPGAQQVTIDALLTQALKCWRMARMAIDELLSARFREFDQDHSGELSLEEFTLLIRSIEGLLALPTDGADNSTDKASSRQGGHVSDTAIVRMYADTTGSASSQGGRVDLHKFLWLCHLWSSN
eukprot:COSAG05_NODE_207_length_14113_cov_13.452119_2_plen_202_part_00